MFQRGRGEGREVGLLHPIEIKENRPQSLAGAESRKVCHPRGVHVEVVHMRSGQPVQTVNFAIGEGHALQNSGVTQIRERIGICLHIHQFQKTQLRHQLQKAQIVVAGHGIGVPVLLADPPGNVVIKGAIGHVVIDVEPVFSGLAEIRVGEIAEIVAHDDHVLDGGQIFLGETSGDIDLGSCLRHDRHRLLRRGLFGSPNQEADDSNQHQGGSCQDQRQAALFLRQGVHDALGGMRRVPPGGGDDVAGVERVFDRVRDGSRVQLHGQHVLRPRGDKVKQRARFAVVGVKAPGQGRQHEIVFPRRLPRHTQPFGLQRVQHRLQSRAVGVAAQQMDHFFTHIASSFKESGFTDQNHREGGLLVPFQRQHIPADRDGFQVR